MKTINRKARFEYEIFDTFEAGIELKGHEAKSTFLGRCNIDDAYVKVKEGQAFLINANIPAYESARVFGYDPKRQRRLLLKKAEILAIETKLKQKNLTLIPLSCYNIGRRLKLEIGLARGKKQFEKKASIKKRDMDRDMEREIRE